MSTVSSKTRIGRCANGWGLHAAERIARDEVIVELAGPIVGQNTETSIQFGQGVYLDGNGDSDDFLNHSCEPNVYVCFSDKTVRVLRDIDAGEEITFDYNCSEFDMEEGFMCRCEAERCLGLVRGFHYLDRQPEAGLATVALSLLVREAGAGVRGGLPARCYLTRHARVAVDHAPVRAAGADSGVALRGLPRIPEMTSWFHPILLCC